MRETKSGSVQFALSAEDLKSRPTAAVFSIDRICVHGPAPYTFVVDAHTREPVVKLCCPRCLGGFEAPSELDVAAAKRWFDQPLNFTAPTSLGARLIAAKELGRPFEFTKGRLVISAKKTTPGMNDPNRSDIAADSSTHTDSNKVG